MQGYNISILLLICQVLTVCISEVSIEENNNMDSKENYLENRRKLPLFPKNSIKFVMTQRPFVEKAYTYSPRKEIMTKMSLMDHFTPRNQIVSQPATKLVNRKPIMKLMTFTINTRVNGKYKIIKNSTNASKKADNSRRTGVQRNNLVTQSTEDYIPDVYLPEESHIHNIEKLPDKIDVNFLDNQNNKEVESGKAVENITIDDINSSVEEQDRNEYIFIESKKKEIVSDLVNNIGQDFDIEDETTTEIHVMENNSRLKRSNNIIEEENVASTVSGLKYTGRDTRLYHDVYFKNINS